MCACMSVVVFGREKVCVSIFHREREESVVVVVCPWLDTFAAAALIILSCLYLCRDLHEQGGHDSRGRGNLHALIGQLVWTIFV